MKKPISVYNYFLIKNIFTTLLIVMFVSNVSAQENVEKMSTITSNKTKSKNWTLLLNNEYVIVNYKYEECNLLSEGSYNENVYLQIVNKTSKEIKAQWNTEYWYNGKCNGCEIGNNENFKTVLLSPNQIVEGECSKECNQALMIFSEMLNFEIKSKLTNFNIRDLQITFVK